MYTVSEPAPGAESTCQKVLMFKITGGKENDTEKCME